MSVYPASIVPVGHVEPVPRRIRAFLAGEKVLDTTRARYVWERPHYPHYYVPLDDVRRELLVPERRAHPNRLGTAELHGLHVGEVERSHAARLFTQSALESLSGTVRFDWNALDAWYEEDEQVFVHPRSPYVRVDALRSHRSARTRARRAATGPRGLARTCTATWPGPTTFRRASCCRLRA